MEFLYGWAAAQYKPLRDITVEDPSPSFVAMRDVADVQFVLDARHDLALVQVRGLAFSCRESCGVGWILLGLLSA